MNEITIVSQFNMVRETALMTVRQSSARIYNDTYKTWIKWCDTNSIDPIEINATSVNDFLVSQNVTYGTRQRQLYAMRKLSLVLATMDYTNPRRKADYEIIKMMSAPDDDVGGQERDTRALSSEQVKAIFDVWAENDSVLYVRNRALISLLFSTGVRRSELVALKWAQIDLKKGVIFIRHGKGDKKRHAAIFGEDAIASLEHWKAVQSDQYQCVFVKTDKHGKLGVDKSISADTLYQIVTITSKLSGVVFRPHDARRTLATTLLAKGMPIADVQAQLGHANASTTLEYAYAGEAEDRRKDHDPKW